MKLLSCCLCLSLRTGCLIIGSLQIILSLISSVLVTMVIANSINVPVIVTSTLVHLLGIVITSLLIHGCRKERPMLLFIWLISHGLGIAVALIGIVGAIMWAVMYSWVYGPTQEVLLGLSAVIAFLILLDIYFMVVVNSHRRQLEENQDEDKKSLCVNE